MVMFSKDLRITTTLSNTGASRSAFVAVCLAGLTASAVAIDFGTLRLYTPAGQPPYAEITLTDSSPLDPADIRARIATRDAYGVAGMRYLPALQQINITPQGAPNGHVLLRLERLPETGVNPDIDLLLLVGDRMSLSLGEYRVNLGGSSREFAAAQAGSRIGSSSTPPASSMAATPAAVVSGSATAVATAPLSNAVAATPAAFAEVRSAIDAWAKAWAARDMDSYVAAYTPDFTGREKNRSHSDWIEQRRSRIVTKKKITVDIDKPQLVARDDKVVATFTQRYRGDAFAETSRKRLQMVRVNGNWLIQDEDEMP